MGRKPPRLAANPPLPGAGEVWRWASGPLYDVAYGDGRFVAVSQGFTILTSP
ncbi:MAG: hypothetical protein NZX11_04925 [Thermus sp.]|nr:hypothetical protein [Thermus sp.]